MKRYNVMQAKEQNDGVWVRYNDAAATLAARDAEIERLKDKAIRFDLDQIGIESRERDAVELVEARTEIERLKAMVETIERDLSEANGDVFIACAKVRSEIEIREKRERQLVWMARAGVWYGSNIMRGYLLHTLEMDEDGDLCGDDRIDCDGTDAGLLAAIDEACTEEAK